MNIADKLTLLPREAYTDGYAIAVCKSFKYVTPSQDVAGEWYNGVTSLLTVNGECFFGRLAECASEFQVEQIEAFIKQEEQDNERV